MRVYILLHAMMDTGTQQMSLIISHLKVPSILPHSLYPHT